MVTVTNPRLYLKRWVKPSLIADQTHCIIRFDGLLLIAYCGRQIPLKNACLPMLGMRHCVDCEDLHRQHMEARRKNVYRKNDR
ncbi:MAG: hypothetical protein ABSG01_09045 [Anaerolineales bacterium]|jgi:hypothetical protein